MNERTNIPYMTIIKHFCFVMFVKLSGTFETLGGKGQLQYRFCVRVFGKARPGILHDNHKR